MATRTDSDCIPNGYCMLSVHLWCLHLPIIILPKKIGIMRMPERMYGQQKNDDAHHLFGAETVSGY